MKRIPGDVAGMKALLVRSPTETVRVLARARYRWYRGTFGCADCLQQGRAASAATLMRQCGSFFESSDSHPGLVRDMMGETTFGSPRVMPDQPTLTRATGSRTWIQRYLAKRESMICLDISGPQAHLAGGWCSQRCWQTRTVLTAPAANS
jgi:hypothetical protein